MLLDCLDLCVCSAYVPSVYVFGKGVWAAPVVGVSLVRELQRGTAHPASIRLQKRSWLSLGPYMETWRAFPSGFIIIMEDDTPDVLIRDMEGGNEQGVGGLCGGSSSSVSSENRHTNPAC